jgi:hypothetical protein
VPPVSARAHRSATRRLETWLWTGPAGHLVGGVLDFAGALSRHLLARYAPARRRRRRR